MTVGELRKAAVKVGLHVETYSPGDGVKRYRFFDKPTDYDAGRGFFTAYGKGEAVAFLLGWEARANYRAAANPNRELMKKQLRGARRRLRSSSRSAARNPRGKRPVRFSETEIETWFERDRAHVELRNKKTQKTIIEFWDDDVGQMVEDGFLNPRDWHRSIFEYAQSVGVL